MHQDDAALLIVALFALGMAIAFVGADRAAPISRAMAATLASIGAAIGLNVLVAEPMHARHEVPLWGGLFALPETLAFICALEWLLRLLRTGTSDSTRADLLLRLAQGLAAFYGLVSLAMPQTRAHQFINLLRHDTSHAMHAPDYGAFLLLATPLAGSLLLAVLAGLLTHRHKPTDQAEKMRGRHFLAGAPLLALAMILPVHAAPFAAAAGLLIFLIGAVKYHVSQGQRAQFMSRFLAPQVASMVARHGLTSALRVRTLDISIVYCDLRGFTAYSVATSPAHVIEVLREYYDAVGAAAATHGGTIKDQAGDGVLILIGAPATFADHAARALDLAREIMRRGLAITQRCSDGDLHLGIGVGVTSGSVAVGVIGSLSRLEYTAVGPAVNLAARLCAAAGHGEILVAPETMNLASSSGTIHEIESARELLLKGFEGLSHCFLVKPMAESRTPA